MILIGISGKKKAGKDTACCLIRENLCSHQQTFRIGFADALKEEVAIACGVSIRHINEYKEQYRLILQGWGDMRKFFNGEDYWIRKVEEAIKPLKDTDIIVIITDVRHKNELEYLYENNGYSLYIWRTIAETQNDNHRSETEISYKDCHNFIYNDRTFESFSAEIAKWLIAIGIINNKTQNV